MFKYIEICLIFFFSLTAIAQNPSMPVKNVSELKERLASMSAEVNTIESQFTQERNLSVLSNKIISQGQFWFKKNNNIRWEYTHPYRYLIIISNNKIFIKEDQSQKQYDIQSSKMFQEMNKFISGCIQGDILKNDQEYKIGYFEDAKNYFVTLMPKSEATRKMLNEVQIWFNKADLTVSAINMVEAGGDYTKITFSNKKLNTDISAEKFSFK
jgi:outer membrane lipoprotein-sorting protein